MKRLLTILIPMLAGFLVTVAMVSWRSGWWQRREAHGSSAAALRVEVRRPNLRIVPVRLTAAPKTSVAAASAVPTPREAMPEPSAATYEPPPVPRVDPGNSAERLEAPERKFAHGSKADEE